VRSGDDLAEASVSPAHPELLSLAREVAAQAAEFVRSRRPEGRVSIAATKSTDTDPVTEIDTATELLIRRAVTAVRPDDGFVGEEGGSSRGTSGVSWVVDPIDGTVNFIYGIPAYAVSIAVEVEGHVVAGVVRNVALGEEYSAVLGGGAMLTRADGTAVPLHVPELADLSLALVATGFGYDAGGRTKQSAAVTALIGQIRDVRRIGSAALDLCQLAAGQVDAYVESGLNVWDRAAGVLVVREAGGVVTGLDTDEPDERLLVAAAGSLHADLRAAVAAAGF
jgi:myo-inositol-1(or 4)-monophosphatase